MVKYIRENGEIKQIPPKCVKDAKALSENEVENLLTDDQRMCRGNGNAIKNGLKVFDNGCSNWWLCTPSYDIFFAKHVEFDGYIEADEPIDSMAGIRPAVIISNPQQIGLQIGDKFKLGGEMFTVISNNLALCDVIVDVCRFSVSDDDAITYENSIVKKKVEQWVWAAVSNDMGLRSNEQIEAENDYGF